MRKMISSLAALVLLGSMLGNHAQAGSVCNPYRPSRAPVTDSTNAEDALREKTIVITDAARERHPLVIEYTHGPGKVFPAHQGDPLINEARYFNFQVDTKSRRSSVFVRASWPTPSVSDIDLYLYAGDGTMIAGSESSNTHIEEASGSSGGPGFESVSGIAWADCRGFTLESQGSMTLGEQMTLTIWVGPRR